MNAELRAVIESETHRRGATRRTSGVWRQSPLATASWSDWALHAEDARHPAPDGRPTPVDALRQRSDNRHVSPLRKAAAIRPALLIRRRYRAGASVATIAQEVSLPESVVRAVLDSPLTQALALLEDDDGNA